MNNSTHITHQTAPAVAAARAQTTAVGRLRDADDGKYSFRTLNPATGEWTESPRTGYKQALVNLAQAKLDIARQVLGLAPIPYDGGSWTEYILRPA